MRPEAWKDVRIAHFRPAARADYVVPKPRAVW
jgi:hypothetical protein